EMAHDDCPSSPALAGVLARETDARTGPLDFNRAAGRAPMGLILAAAASLLLFAPAFAFPKAAATLATRFFLPWATPEAEPDFTFRVERGDAVVARGRPFAFNVTLVPRDERVQLPAVAYAAVRTAEGTSRHALAPVAPDSPDYAGAARIAADGEYRYEAGNSASESFTLTTIQPVELAPSSPAVEIVPPEYARVTQETETAIGLGELSALAHSEIRFAFRFNRAPVAAWMEWTPTGKATRRVAIVAGKASLPATEEGDCRVVLEAEHGIRTELEGGKLSLRRDLPPALLKVQGALDARKVRPYDRLSIEARVADDIALADACLQWKLNTSDKVDEEPIRLDGSKREAVARHVLQLASKAKPGDVVSYRLRFRDNLPARLGGPNVLHHPEKGWHTLDIVDAAKSPREEEINAKRDALAGKIDELLATLKQEMRASDKARAESRIAPSLSREHRKQVERAQKLNEEVRKGLDEWAALAEKEPETSPLADKAKAVREEEMKTSGEALAKTLEEGARPEAREREFRAVEKELHQAFTRLEDLKAENEKLARDRIDQAKVVALAEKQKQLAEKAAELEKDDKKKAEELAREQAKAEKELKELEAGSELLRKAAEEARAEQARKEAEAAAELAKEQRELAKASAETEKKLAKERLADLAKKQEELAAKAEKLARDTARTLEANRSQPLKPEDAKRAAGSLAKGEPDKAMAEQDRAARDLDKLARDLERFAEQRKDPREAAKQLAIAEENLAKRTREGRDLPDPAEQRAIREALAELSAPPARKDIAAERKKAEEALAQAEEELKKGDRDAAARKMDAARDALRKMSAKMPTLEERKREARAELQKLRAQQEELARLLEQAKRPEAPESRLDDVARKQEALAKRLEKLDAPNLEERRDKAREEMAQAAEDMKARNADDAKLAQERAKRSLDRLAEALAGKKPAEEKARDLARKQRELMAELEKLGPDAPAWKKEAAKWAQRALAEQAKNLPAPDAPSLKRDAAKAAEDAAKAPTREAMAEAARKLDKLAEALAGKESDQEKAARLARKQGEAAEKAKRGKKPDDDARKAMAEELKALRAGEAKAEKKAAVEALNAASDARLAGDKAKAERDAADRLKELADKLAGRRSDADKAAEIAREQKEVADDAARGRKGLEDRQADLARQAGKLGERARDAKKAMDDAAKAMADGRDAAPKADAAAKAAEKLARDLGGDPSPKKERVEGGKGSPLEGKNQADAARDLAKAQRDLKEEVRRGKDGMKLAEGPSSEKLAKEQADIARDAAKLARSVKGEQGEKSAAAAKAGEAGEASGKASRDLASGALDKAAKGGEEAEKALRDLAGALKDTPRGTKPGEPDTFEEARKLARRQGELNKELAPKAGDPSAQRGQQAARQGDLEKRASELAQRLDKLAGESAPQPAAA
ncbi:MAG: hypothetical protein K2W96_16900, partial [Gemmataceae bacterium]|nr:hypothetical protein [Gemmataceae bacterium]